MVSLFLLDRLLWAGGWVSPPGTQVAIRNQDHLNQEPNATSCSQVQCLTQFGALLAGIADASADAVVDSSFQPTGPLPSTDDLVNAHMARCNISQAKVLKYASLVGVHQLGHFILTFSPVSTSHLVIWLR
jgi:hypothetical protein